MLCVCSNCRFNGDKVNGKGDNAIGDVNVNGNGDNVNGNVDNANTNVNVNGDNANERQRQ